VAYHTIAVVVGANQEVVAMATVKDRVADMWGMTIANDLAAAGLLLPDDADSIVNDVEPTRWRIYGKADLRNPKWLIPPGAQRGAWNPPPHPMKSPLKHWVFCVNYLLNERAGHRTAYANKNYYEDRADEILGWQSYDVARKSTALSQARYLRNVGFEVRVVGLATIETGEVPV
jgi:hypothetical protein